MALVADAALPRTCTLRLPSCGHTNHRASQQYRFQLLSLPCNLLSLMLFSNSQHSIELQNS